MVGVQRDAVLLPSWGGGSILVGGQSGVPAFPCAAVFNFDRRLPYVSANYKR